MSATIDQWWVYKFNDQVNLVFQQMESRLVGRIDPSMVHNDVRGAIDHHERLDNLIANDVVSPFAPMVPLNPESSRRAVTLQSSDAPVLVSDENTLRSMAEPNSPYTRTIVAALQRRRDKHVIDAAIGSAQVAVVASGTGVISYTTQAMLSAHILGTYIAITLANIIAANELLSKGSVPSGFNNRTFAYSPGQLRDLLAITQASSSDFTKNRIHDTGTVDGIDWEGFRFIEIPDVVSAAKAIKQRMLPAPASNQRQCIAFGNGALGVSTAKAAGPPSISTRHDLQSEPTQIRVHMMMAAVRVWETGVVQLNVLEN